VIQSLKVFVSFSLGSNSSTASQVYVWYLLLCHNCIDRIFFLIFRIMVSSKWNQHFNLCCFCNEVDVFVTGQNGGMLKTKNESGEAERVEQARMALQPNGDILDFY
jgi:hypothetical protein